MKTAKRQNMDLPVSCHLASERQLDVTGTCVMSRPLNEVSPLYNWSDLVESIKQITLKLLSERGKPGANLLNIIYSRPFVAINRALQASQIHSQ